MCFVSFKILDLRTSSTGVRTSEKLDHLPRRTSRSKKKSSPVWYTIFMLIQRLCYLGGSITEALPGVGVQGEKSIHLRVTEEQRAQLILRGRGKLGNRENMGNKGTGTIFPPWECLISSL